MTAKLVYLKIVMDISSNQPLVGKIDAHIRNEQVKDKRK
jgi:hypothetical protein